MTQQEQEKDILGKILVTVSALCLILVAAFPHLGIRAGLMPRDAQT